MLEGEEKLGLHRDLLTIETRIQKGQRNLLYLIDDSIEALKKEGKQDEAERQEQRKAIVLFDQLIAGPTVYKKVRETELALAKAITSGKWEKQRQGNKRDTLCNAPNITTSENNPSILIEEVERWLLVRTILENRHADANFLAEELRLNQTIKRNQLNESLLSADQIEKIKDAESWSNINQEIEQSFRIIQYLYGLRLPPSLSGMLEDLRDLDRKILIEKISHSQNDPANDAEKQSLQSALRNQILDVQKQTEQEIEEIDSNIVAITKTAGLAQAALSSVLSIDKHTRQPLDERERIKLRVYIKKLSSLELQSLSVLRKFDDEMMQSNSVWSNKNIKYWSSCIDDISKKKIRDSKNRRRNLEEKLKDLEEEKEKLLSTVTADDLLIAWRDEEIKKLMPRTEETQPLIIKSNLETVGEKLSNLSEIENERGCLLHRNKTLWGLVHDQLALQKKVLGQIARQQIFQTRLTEVKERIDGEIAHASTTQTKESATQVADTELTGTTLVSPEAEKSSGATAENALELEIVKELTELHGSLSKDLKEIQDELVLALNSKALKALEERQAQLTVTLLNFENKLFNLENEHLPKVWETVIEEPEALYGEVASIDPLLETAAEQYLDFTRLYLASRIRLEQFMEDVIAQRNAFLQLPEEAKIHFNGDQNIGLLVNQYPEFVKLVIAITKITQPEWTNADIVELIKDWQTKELKILDHLRSNNRALREDDSIDSRLNLIRVFWHQLETRMGAQLFRQFDVSMQALMKAVEQSKVTSSLETEQNNPFSKKMDHICALWSKSDTKTHASEFHQFSTALDELFNDWRENESLIDDNSIQEQLGKVREHWLRREPMMYAPVLHQFNEQIDALKTEYQRRSVLLPQTSEVQLSWLATFRSLWADRVIILEDNVFQELIYKANAVNIDELPPELSEVMLHLKAAQTGWSRQRVDNAARQCEKQLIEFAQEFKAHQESMAAPEIEITETYFQKQVTQSLGSTSANTNDDTALRRLIDARKLDYERRKEKIDRLEPLLEVLDSWLDFGDPSLSDLRRGLDAANNEKVGDTTIAQVPAFATNIEARLQEGRAYLNQPACQRLIADYKLNIEERLKSEEQKYEMQSTYSQFVYDQIISLNNNHLRAVQLQINNAKFTITDTWFFERLDTAIVSHWTRLRQREKRYGITNTEEQNEDRLTHLQTAEGSDYLSETSDSLKNDLERQLNRRLQSDYYEEAYHEEIENLRKVFQELPERSARRVARALNFSPEKTEKHVKARLKEEELSIQKMIDEVNASSDSQNSIAFARAVETRMQEKLRRMKGTADYKEQLNEMMISYLDHFQTALDLSKNAGVSFPLHNEICTLLKVQATHEQYQLISSEISRIVREHFFPIGGLSLIRKLVQLQDRQTPDATHFAEAKQKVENLVHELNARIAADASDISGLSSTRFISSEAIRKEVEADPEEAKKYLKKLNDLLNEVNALISKEEEKVRSEVKEIETLVGQDKQSSSLLSGLQALPKNDRWLDIITSALTDEQSKSAITLRREVDSAKSGLEEGESSYVSRELQILSGLLREQEDGLEKIKREIVLPIQIHMVKKLLDERAKWDRQHQQAKEQMEKIAKYMRLIAIAGVIQEQLDLLNGNKFEAFREEPQNEKFSEIHGKFTKLLEEAKKYIQSLETGSIALSKEAPEQSDVPQSSSKQLAEKPIEKGKEVAKETRGESAQSLTEPAKQLLERLKRKTEEKRTRQQPLEQWLKARDSVEIETLQQEIDSLSRLSVHESLRREVLQALNMLDIVERSNPSEKETTTINAFKSTLSNIKTQLIKLEKTPNEKQLKNLKKVVSNSSNLILKKPVEIVTRHQKDLCEKEAKLIEDDKRRINEIRGSLKGPDAPAGWDAVLELPLKGLEASLTKQDELLRQLEEIKTNVIASRDNPKEWFSACKSFEDKFNSLELNRKEQQIEHNIVTLEFMLDIPDDLERNIQRLEEEKNDLIKERDTLAKESETLRGVIRNIQNMNAILRTSLAQRQNELNEATSALSDQENISNNLVNVNALLQRGFWLAQHNFDQVRQLHNALRHAHGSALTRIGELSNETSELNRKLELTSDFDAQQRSKVTSIKTELEDITKELEKLMHHIDEMEKQLKAEMDTHAHTKNELQIAQESHAGVLTRIGELSNETSELNRKLELTLDFDAQQRSKVTSIKTELEDITKEREKLMHHIDEMERQLKAEMDAHAHTKNELQIAQESHRATEGRTSEERGKPVENPTADEVKVDKPKPIEQDPISPMGGVLPQTPQQQRKGEPSKTGDEVTPDSNLFEPYVRVTRKTIRKNIFRGITKNVPGDVEKAIDAYKNTHSDTADYDEMKLSAGGGTAETTPVIRSPGFLIAIARNPETSKPAFLILKDIDFSRVKEKNAKDKLGNNLHASITLTFEALQQRQSQESHRGKIKKVGSGKG